MHLRSWMGHNALWLFSPQDWWHKVASGQWFCTTTTAHIAAITRLLLRWIDCGQISWRRRVPLTSCLPVYWRAHGLPVLADLHWLLVRQHITFQTDCHNVNHTRKAGASIRYKTSSWTRTKTCVKILRGYFRPGWTNYANKLAEHKLRVVAPAVWNSIPVAMCACNSVQTSKHSYKYFYSR